MDSINRFYLRPANQFSTQRSIARGLARRGRTALAMQVRNRSTVFNLAMEAFEMRRWKQFFSVYLLAILATFGLSSAQAYEVNRTVGDFMADEVRLATLWKAIKIAGLEDVMQGAGPFTIFAPDNLAFEQLGRGTFDDLIKDKDKLAKVLKFHVIPGEKILLSDQTKGYERLKTLEGQELSLSKPKKKRFLANKAQVLEKDEITANNGVVHIIDRVLLPPTGL
jgi:uncharacterized surface protein with fasciclin (FAS1) repeats